MPADCEDLLHQMLEKDPLKRIKIGKILTHKFFENFKLKNDNHKRKKLNYKDIWSKGVLRLIKQKKRVKVQLKKL